MKINPSALLEIAGISRPLVATYDVPDAKPFEPFTEPGQCIFESYDRWLKGQSTRIDSENAAAFGCPGAGYWLCGIETMPKEDVAGYLAGQEGLKASPDTMCRWLENHPPHRLENQALVISQLKDDQHAFLKTVTFFVDPDQLALLLTGAEYLNAAPDKEFVMAPYGSGCGQLLPIFRNLDAPRAAIGATDIAARKYLPQDILAFTVTTPMFEQLCRLDENSFLHKSFWNDLKRSRMQQRAAI